MKVSTGHEPCTTGQFLNALQEPHLHGNVAVQGQVWPTDTASFLPIPAIASIVVCCSNDDCRQMLLLLATSLDGILPGCCPISIVPLWAVGQILVAISHAPASTLLPAALLLLGVGWACLHPCYWRLQFALRTGARRGAGSQQGTIAPEAEPAGANCGVITSRAQAQTMI